MGRQPWVVYGLLKTAKGVSPIGTGYVVTTLIGFTAIYTHPGHHRLRPHGPLRQARPGQRRRARPAQADRRGRTTEELPADFDGDDEHHDDRAPALIY